MTEQQIKKRLSKICEDYLSKLPNGLRDEVRGDLFVAGGCISSMLLNEAYSDYDIFFRTKETADEIREYYCKHALGWHTTVLSEQVKEVISGKLWKSEDVPSEYEPIMITENAITLQGKIQLITKFYGDPQKVVESFDFKHLHCYYVLNTDFLYVPDYVYKLLLNRKLVYTGSEFPINSLSRVDKYVKKGWTSSPLMKVAMILDIHRKVDLGDFKAVLRSALGIDPNSELVSIVERLENLTDTNDLITQIEFL